MVDEQEVSSYKQRARQPREVEVRMQAWGERKPRERGGQEESTRKEEEEPHFLGDRVAQLGEKAAWPEMSIGLNQDP